MTAEPSLAEDPILNAAMDMLRRTGASGVQVRYSDDEEPVVWMAVGTWGRGDEVIHDTAAALDPRRAFLRLLEQVIDGGTCQHCQRPTGFEPDHFDEMPADELFCWYQYDPELRTFRRGCE